LATQSCKTEEREIEHNTFYVDLAVCLSNSLVPLFTGSTICHDGYIGCINTR